MDVSVVVAIITLISVIVTPIITVSLNICTFFILRCIRTQLKPYKQEPITTDSKMVCKFET